MSKTIYASGKKFPISLRNLFVAFLFILWISETSAQHKSKTNADDRKLTANWVDYKPASSKAELGKPVMQMILKAVPDSQRKPNVYKINPWVDVPLTVAGVAGTLYGFYKIGAKTKPDSMEAATLWMHKDRIPKFDRWAAGKFSVKADDASDILFYGSYPAPLLLLLSPRIRREAGSVYLLYVETMGLVGSGYANTDGHINRYRPYTYGEHVPIGKKWNKNAQNSFYGGHPSAVAGATFFAARVFSDFHPDSKIRYLMYGAAMISTGATAYLRHRGGNHFPSDLAIGCAIGPAIGILVPHLHLRNKYKKGVSVLPFTGEHHGLVMKYKW